MAQCRVTTGRRTYTKKYYTFENSQVYLPFFFLLKAIFPLGKQKCHFEPIIRVDF